MFGEVGWTICYSKYWRVARRRTGDRLRSDGEHKSLSESDFYGGRLEVHVLCIVRRV